MYHLNHTPFVASAQTLGIACMTVWFHELQHLKQIFVSAYHSTSHSRFTHCASRHTTVLPEFMRLARHYFYQWDHKLNDRNTCITRFMTWIVDEIQLRVAQELHICPTRGTSYTSDCIPIKMYRLILKNVIELSDTPISHETILVVYRLSL